MIPKLTTKTRARLQARADRTGATLYVFARAMLGGLGVVVATKRPRVVEYLIFGPRVIVARTRGYFGTYWVRE